MNPIEWVDAHVLGFTNLSAGERDAIMHFSLLWGILEGAVFRPGADAGSMLATARDLQAKGCLNRDDFDNELTYFQNRYVANGAFTEHFRTLYLNGRPRALVKSVLKNENNDTCDVVAALLIIVYRFRNNLFHGMKWIDGIQGQLDNFKHANSLLMRVYELHMS